MKNPVLYYVVIALGVIALAIGIVYMTGSLGPHQTRAIGGIVVGAILLIVGVVGILMARTPNTAAK
jgi:uncharacterized membrane protein HdeD (DUF308 family)